MDMLIKTVKLLQTFFVMDSVMQAILLGLGLQHKTVEVLTTELDVPSTQILALFNRCMRRIVQFIRRLMEQSVEETLLLPASGDQTDKLNPLKQSMDKELEAAAKVQFLPTYLHTH